MTDHYVRPDVRAFLEYLNNLPGPRGPDAGPKAAREMMVAGRHLLDADSGELAVVRDLTAPGPAGEIGLRFYDCRAERGPGPLLVVFHGGGWVLGDLDTHDPLCAETSRALDIPVLAVDYRLAPENPFPAGIEDALAATRWAAASPGELGREVTGLVLAGDSAGGNLALVVCAALRDEPAAVPVIAQWAIYPAADPTVRYPSYDEFSEGFLLTKPSMDWFEDSYAGPKNDWRYSPLLKGVEGLPPTFVLTASLDPIRDQGRAYAAACVQAGVQTTYLEAQGTIHGFLNLRKAVPSANEDLRQCFELLRPMIRKEP